MLTNTDERWGSIAIGLHWLIAGLILVVQVPIGITMLALSPGALQNTLFTTHKSVGLLVLGLAIVRLVWRMLNPTPRLPTGTPGWQERIAKYTHVVLYALIFLLPVSGYLYTAAGGFPVPFFGYDLGRLIPKNEPLAAVGQAIHYWSQFALYLVAAAHVGGALQHHWLRRDNVLRRMLTSR